MCNKEYILLNIASSHFHIDTDDRHPRAGIDDSAMLLRML